jgi:hypothetical protein
MSTIYISIASYRDPQLLPTLHDCLEKADHPENLVFGIAWQHAEEDTWDDLNEFRNDTRFRIVNIDYKDSKGACWARNQIHNHYGGEDYYLQLDSHHRFVEGWDTECIKMVKQLQKKGHKKPLLTAYASSFDPDNDPAGRTMEPWWMTFDRFIPEGAVFFLPATIPDWKKLKSPIPARFLSAHFIFTLGKWCEEVPYDPDYYFHGEEISLAVRSYTWGYDLFHPHKIIVWHEYTRKGRTKQWDDDPEWVQKNVAAHKKNRALFAVDGECRCGLEFGRYDFGTERSLQQYEAYAGLRFRDRATQAYTRENKFAPNPFITGPLDYDLSFQSVFKHCIDIYPHQVPLVDYDLWVVAFEDKDGNELYRYDADLDEINRMKLDFGDGYYKIWREFATPVKPAKWIVWPHSLTNGWCERLEGVLP